MEEEQDELKSREFNKILDQYLIDGTISEDDYHRLTPKQRDVIQCIKRSIKRILK